MVGTCRPGGVGNFYDHLIIISSSYPCLLTSNAHHLPHPEGRFLSVSRWNNSIRLGRLSNLSRRIKFQASVFYLPHLLFILRIMSSLLILLGISF